MTDESSLLLAGASLHPTPDYNKDHRIRNCDNILLTLSNDFPFLPQLTDSISRSMTRDKGEQAVMPVHFHIITLTTIDKLEFRVQNCLKKTESLTSVFVWWLNFICFNRRVFHLAL